MGSSKVVSDFRTGLNNRELVAKDFNAAAIEAHSIVQIRRYHPDLQMFTPSEKARFNTQRNRDTNKDPEKAMGLDYEMYTIHDPEVMDSWDPKILHIRFSDSSGYYIKIPSDRLGDSEEYLEEIADRTWIMFVYKNGDRPLPLYSGLISLRSLMRLPHALSRDPGNKNRMVFHYGLSHIQYLPANHGRGFIEESTIRQMEYILQSG